MIQVSVSSDLTFMKRDNARTSTGPKSLLLPIWHSRSKMIGRNRKDPGLCFFWDPGLCFFWFDINEARSCQDIGRTQAVASSGWTFLEGRSAYSRGRISEFLREVVHILEGVRILE